MRNAYAVMGYPIHHSLSPTIHRLFAEQTQLTLTYEKIQIDLANFEQQVLSFFTQGGRGLNITLPCKQRAYALADNASLRCQKAGAANMLWRDNLGLRADNTDGVGLLRDINNYIDIAGMRILLLGAGGAARGIIDSLLKANPMQLVIANRTPEKAYGLSREYLSTTSCEMSDLSGIFDLVINATSVSLSDERLTLPSTIFTTSTFFYDLGYCILTDTPLVTWARQQGCMAVDGLGMLVEQAAEAFFIWHGIMPKTASVLHDLRKKPPVV